LATITPPRHVRVQEKCHAIGLKEKTSIRCVGTPPSAVYIAFDEERESELGRQCVNSILTILSHYILAQRLDSLCTLSLPTIPAVIQSTKLSSLIMQNNNNNNNNNNASSCRLTSSNAKQHDNNNNDDDDDDDDDDGQI
jgi:hypothetical protein